MGRRITILGMGPSASDRRFDIARYVAGTEVWGLNNGFGRYPGFAAWARWYEIHGIDYLAHWTEAQGGLGYFRAIDGLGVPCYRTDVLPIVRQQTEFPELAMARHFGINYWDGTPSRMFAHAIYEHDKGATIDFIQSYGIDMQDSQHAAQLGPWLFWVAMAHARGIKLGGTMLDRMNDVESDEGTRHLRAAIGAAMSTQADDKQATGRTDYTVVNCHTPSYQAKADRLAAQCEALGVAHDFCLIPEQQDASTAYKAVAAHGIDHAQTVAEATGRPVLWIDADDELTATPTLPEGDGCGFGFWANPEKQIIQTALEAGNGFALWPTEQGRAACDILRANVAAGLHTHRAICATVSATTGLLSRFGTVDISRNVKGCITITPGSSRPAACRT